MERVRPILEVRLPKDVVSLIFEHAAASLIQRRWVRYAHFGHVHHPHWKQVSGLLMHKRFLHMFSNVRREWRREPGSWIHVSYTGDVKLLCDECARGLWGATSRRLSH